MQRFYCMLLDVKHNQPVAAVRGESFAKVAINLMNTCRVSIKDMFTFSREKRSGESVLLLLLACLQLLPPVVQDPVPRLSEMLCVSSGHFPPVSSN